MRIGSERRGRAQGHLLVDTGASVSVCRPGVFSHPVDPNNKFSLFSVDDTALNCQGAVGPTLAPPDCPDHVSSC